MALSQGLLYTSIRMLSDPTALLMDNLTSVLNCTSDNIVRKVVSLGIMNLNS